MSTSLSAGVAWMVKQALNGRWNCRCHCFQCASPRLLESAGCGDAGLRVTDLSQAELASTALLCEDRSLDLWQAWYGQQPHGQQPRALANPRRVIADVTRDGGYPALMIDNVDFATLYRQKLEQLRQEKKQQEQPN